MMDMQTLRHKTLEYIASMRVENNSHKYRYCERAKLPVLYASCYAALTRHLYGDLDRTSAREKKEWASYIQSFQDNDGLFKDPVVADSAHINSDGWGWRHLTCHAIMALSCLRKTAEKEFTLVQPFYNPDFVKKWLAKRDWSTPNSSNTAGNEILNLGTLLQYARNFHHDKKAGKAVDVMLEWLTENQNPQYGAWGPDVDLKNKIDLAEVMMGGYHEFLLFLYDNRKIKHTEVIIDRLFSLQNETGGFTGPDHPVSSACQDIDCLDPLVRLSFQTKHGKEAMKNTLKKAVRCILSHQNSDGGFCFYKDLEFFYGHKETMSSGVNESAMFPTWFRTLSLAIAAQGTPDSELGKYDWRFIDCPGYQFWK